MSIGWLRKAFADGARGVKIWKEIGLEIKRPDGGFLMPDDPVFGPIYTFIAQRRKVLVAHLAEPIDAWLPLDPRSPHYSYYSMSGTGEVKYTGRTVQALNLPRRVLEKVYHQNATRLLQLNETPRVTGVR